jgi:uncharacterized lipoprotein YddW (UPF0748 family)
MRDATSAVYQELLVLLRPYRYWSFAWLAFLLGSLPFLQSPQPLPFETSSAEVGGQVLAAAQQPDPTAASEVRALWVDAFHDGAKSPTQVAKLIADAKRANVNTLLVQVRRRGDLLYPGGPEPTVADLAPNFDALRAVLDAAHSANPRIEVHAWLPVYTIWSSTTPPSDPRHLLHRHGPTATGQDNWLMWREDGEQFTGEGYWLDPGHPDVQTYFVDLVTDLLRRYDVDGVHLDRVRYYEGEADRRWGYNPWSVIRFDLENGRVNQPAPTDPLWMQYRRDRVTELVQKVHDTVLAIRPSAKLSAAAIPWGNGPQTRAEWMRASAYSAVFQDWRQWLESGLVDQLYVMNYNREQAANQAGYLDRWLAFERANTYGRQVIPGLAVYLNDPADSLKQIRRALAPGPDGSRLAGVALYSYAVPDPTRANTDPADDSPEGLLWELLSRPRPENEQSPPFAQPAGVPAMSWRK